MYGFTQVRLRKSFKQNNKYIIVYIQKEAVLFRKRQFFSVIHLLVDDEMFYICT